MKKLIAGAVVAIALAPGGRICSRAYRRCSLGRFIWRCRIGADRRGSRRRSWLYSRTGHRQLVGNAAIEQALSAACRTGCETPR